MAHLGHMQLKLGETGGPGPDTTVQATFNDDGSVSMERTSAPHSVLNLETFTHRIRQLLTFAEQVEAMRRTL